MPQNPNKFVYVTACSSKEAMSSKELEIYSLRVSMSNQKSTIIINDLTSIDHAVIDAEGSIIGGSFNLSVVITGNIDDKEGVVIDFSTIKKKIKEIIDDVDTGLDHALWITKDSKIVTDNDKLPYENMSTLDTGCIEIRSEAYVFRMLPCNYLISELEDYIQKFLMDSLRFFGYDVDIKAFLNTKVKSLNSEVVATEKNTVMFRTAHGLKNSTSQGCQNIAHGHLSFIQVLDSSFKLLDLPKIFIQALSFSLDQSYFINQSDLLILDDFTNPEKGKLDVDSFMAMKDGGEFVKPEDALLSVSEDLDDFKSSMKAAYNSQSRGYFEINFKQINQPIHIIPSDTTIEYIVEYVKTKFFDILKELPNAKYLCVSEGLSKGSITEI